MSTSAAPPADTATFRAASSHPLDVAWSWTAEATLSAAANEPPGAGTAARTRVVT
jgi:hypothetical protein